MVKVNRMLALICFFGFQCAMSMETDVAAEYDLILTKVAYAITTNNESEIKECLEDYDRLKARDDILIDLPPLSLIHI